jgi:hypothetical protein
LDEQLESRMWLILVTGNRNRNKARPGSLEKELHEGDRRARLAQPKKIVVKGYMDPFPQSRGCGGDNSPVPADLAEDPGRLSRIELDEPCAE